MNIFKNLFGRKKPEGAKGEINRYFRTGIFNKFVSVLVTVCFVISIVNLPAFASVEDNLNLKKKKDEAQKQESVFNTEQSMSIKDMMLLADRKNKRLDKDSGVIMQRNDKGAEEPIGTLNKNENGEWVATRTVYGKIVEDKDLRDQMLSKPNIYEYESNTRTDQQNNVLGASNEQTNTVSNTPANVSEQENQSVIIGLPSDTNKEKQEKINEPKIDNNIDEPNKVAENKQEGNVISSTVIGEYKPEQKNEQEVSDVVNEQNKKEDNLATPGATNTTNVANTDISNTNKNDNVLNNQTNENQISSVENATNSVAQILNDTQKGLMAPVSVAMDAAISVVSENTNNLNLPTKLMNSAKNIVNGTKSIGNVGTAKLTSKKPITEKKVTKAQAINNSAKTVNDRIKKLSEKKGTIKIDAKSNETVTKGKNTTTRNVTESYTTKSGNKVNVEATHKSTKKAKGVKEFEYNRTKTVKDSKGNLKGKTETSRKLTVSKNGKVTGTETVKVYDKNGKLVKTITRKISGTRKVIKDKKGNNRVVYKLNITGTQKEKKNGKWVETKLKKESRTYINTYRKVGNKIYKTHSRISTIDGKTTRISASETIENDKKTVRRTVEKNGKVTRFTEEGTYKESTASKKADTKKKAEKKATDTKKEETKKATDTKKSESKKETETQTINDSAKEVTNNIKNTKADTIIKNLKTNTTISKKGNATVKKTVESYTKDGAVVKVTTTRTVTKNKDGSKTITYNKVKESTKDGKVTKTVTNRTFTAGKDGKIKNGTENITVTKDGKTAKTIDRTLNGTRKVIKDKNGNHRVIYDLTITGTQTINGKKTTLKKEHRVTTSTYRKVKGKIYKTYSRVSTIDGKTTKINSSIEIENGKKTVTTVVEAANGKTTKLEGTGTEKTATSINNKIRTKYGKEGLDVINKISKQTGIDKNTIYKELAKAGVTKDKLKKAASVLLSQMSKGAKIINCSAEALSNVITKANKALLAIQQLAIDIVTGAYFSNNKKGDSQIQTSMAAQKKVLNSYEIKADGYSISLANLKSSLKSGESAIVHVNNNHFITVSKNSDGSFIVKDNNVNKGKAVKYSDAEFTDLMKNKYKVTGTAKVLTSSKSVAKEGIKLTNTQMKNISGAGLWGAITGAWNRHVVRPVQRAYTRYVAPHVNRARSWVRSSYSRARSWVRSSYSRARSWARSTYSRASSWARSTYSSVSSWARNTYNGAVNAYRTGGFGGLAGYAQQTIGSTIGTVFNAAKNFAGNAIGTIGSSIGSAIGGRIGGVVGGFLGGINGAVNGWKKDGLNGAINGLFTGVSSGSANGSQLGTQIGGDLGKLNDFNKYLTRKLNPFSSAYDDAMVASYEHDTLGIGSQGAKEEALVKAANSGDLNDDQKKVIVSLSGGEENFDTIYFKHSGGTITPDQAKTLQSMHTAVSGESSYYSVHWGDVAKTCDNINENSGDDSNHVVSIDRNGTIKTGYKTQDGKSVCVTCYTTANSSGGYTTKHYFSTTSNKTTVTDDNGCTVFASKIKTIDGQKVAVIDNYSINGSSFNDLFNNKSLNSVLSSKNFSMSYQNSVGCIIYKGTTITQKPGEGGNGGGGGSGDSQTVVTKGIIHDLGDGSYSIEGVGSIFSIDEDGNALIAGEGAVAVKGSTFIVSSKDSDEKTCSTRVECVNGTYGYSSNSGWMASENAKFKFTGTVEQNRAYINACVYRSMNNKITTQSLKQFDLSGEFSGSFMDFGNVMAQEMNHKGIENFYVYGKCGMDGPDGPQATEATYFKASVIRDNDGQYRFQMQCTEKTTFNTKLPEGYSVTKGKLNDTYTLEKGEYATLAAYLSREKENITISNGTNSLTGAAIVNKEGETIGFNYKLTKAKDCEVKAITSKVSGDVTWEEGSAGQLDFSNGKFIITSGILAVDGLTVTAEQFNNITGGDKGSSSGEENNNTINEKYIADAAYFESDGITQSGDQVIITGTFHNISETALQRDGINTLLGCLYSSKSTLKKGDLIPGGASVQKTDEKTGKKVSTGSSTFDNNVKIGTNGEWEILDAQFKWDLSLLDGNSENNKKFANYLGFTGGQIAAGIVSLAQYNPITIINDFIYTKITGDESRQKERDKEITRLAYGIKTTNQEYAATTAQQVTVKAAVVAVVVAVTVAFVIVTGGTGLAAIPGILGAEGAGIFATGATLSSCLTTSALASASVTSYFTASAALGAMDAYDRGDMLGVGLNIVAGILAFACPFKVGGLGAEAAEKAGVDAASEAITASAGKVSSEAAEQIVANVARESGEVAAGAAARTFTEAGISLSEQTLTKYGLETGVSVLTKVSTNITNRITDFGSKYSNVFSPKSWIAGGRSGAIDAFGNLKNLMGANGVDAFVGTMNELSQSMWLMTKLQIAMNAVGQLLAPAKALLNSLGANINDNTAQGKLYNFIFGDMEKQAKENSNIFAIDPASSLQFAVIMYVGMPFFQGLAGSLRATAPIAESAVGETAANSISGFIRNEAKSVVTGIYEEQVKENIVQYGLTGMGVPPQWAEVLSEFLTAESKGEFSCEKVAEQAVSATKKSDEKKINYQMNAIISKTGASVAYVETATKDGKGIYSYRDNSGSQDGVRTVTTENNLQVHIAELASVKTAKMGGTATDFYNIYNALNKFAVDTINVNGEEGLNAKQAKTMAFVLEAMDINAINESIDKDINIEDINIEKTATQQNNYKEIMLAAQGVDTISSNELVEQAQQNAFTDEFVNTFVKQIDSMYEVATINNNFNMSGWAQLAKGTSNNINQRSRIQLLKTISQSKYVEKGKINQQALIKAINANEADALVDFYELAALSFMTADVDVDFGFNVEEVIAGISNFETIKLDIINTISSIAVLSSQMKNSVSSSINAKAIVDATVEKINELKMSESEVNSLSSETFWNLVALQKSSIEKLNDELGEKINIFNDKVNAIENALKEAESLEEQEDIIKKQKENLNTEDGIVDREFNEYLSDKLNKISLTNKILSSSINGKAKGIATRNLNHLSASEISEINDNFDIRKLTGLSLIEMGLDVNAENIQFRTQENGAIPRANIDGNLYELSLADLIDFGIINSERDINVVEADSDNIPSSYMLQVKIGNENRNIVIDANALPGDFNLNSKKYGKYIDAMIDQVEDFEGLTDTDKKAQIEKYRTSETNKLLAKFSLSANLANISPIGTDGIDRIQVSKEGSYSNKELRLSYFDSSIMLSGLENFFGENGIEVELDNGKKVTVTIDLFLNDISRNNRLSQLGESSKKIIEKLSTEKFVGMEDTNGIADRIKFLAGNRNNPEFKKVQTISKNVKDFIAEQKRKGISGIALTNAAYEYINNINGDDGKKGISGEDNKVDWLMSFMYEYVKESPMWGGENAGSFSASQCEAVSALFDGYDFALGMGGGKTPIGCEGIITHIALFGESASCEILVGNEDLDNYTNGDAKKLFDMFGIKTVQSRQFKNNNGTWDVDGLVKAYEDPYTVVIMSPQDRGFLKAHAASVGGETATKINTALNSPTYVMIDEVHKVAQNQVSTVISNGNNSPSKEEIARARTYAEKIQYEKIVNNMGKISSDMSEENREYKHLLKTCTIEIGGKVAVAKFRTEAEAMKFKDENVIAVIGVEAVADEVLLMGDAQQLIKDAVGENCNMSEFVSMVKGLFSTDASGGFADMGEDGIKPVADNGPQMSMVPSDYYIQMGVLLKRATTSNFESIMEAFTQISKTSMSVSNKDILAGIQGTIRTMTGTPGGYEDLIKNISGSKGVYSISGENFDYEDETLSKLPFNGNRESKINALDDKLKDQIKKVKNNKKIDGELFDNFLFCAKDKETIEIIREVVGRNYKELQKLGIDVYEFTNRAGKWTSEDSYSSELEQIDENGDNYQLTQIAKNEDNEYGRRLIIANEFGMTGIDDQGRFYNYLFDSSRMTDSDIAQELKRNGRTVSDSKLYNKARWPAQRILVVDNAAISSRLANYMQSEEFVNYARNKGLEDFNADKEITKLFEEIAAPNANIAKIISGKEKEATKLLSLLNSIKVRDSVTRFNIQDASRDALLIKPFRTMFEGKVSAKTQSVLQKMLEDNLGNMNYDGRADFSPKEDTFAIEEFDPNKKIFDIFGSNADAAIEVFENALNVPEVKNNPEVRRYIEAHITQLKEAKKQFDNVPPTENTPLHKATTVTEFMSVLKSFERYIAPTDALEQVTELSKYLEETSVSQETQQALGIENGVIDVNSQSFKTAKANGLVAEYNGKAYITKLGRNYIKVSDDDDLAKALAILLGQIVLDGSGDKVKKSISVDNVKQMLKVDDDDLARALAILLAETLGLQIEGYENISVRDLSSHSLQLLGRNLSSSLTEKLALAKALASNNINIDGLSALVKLVKSEVITMDDISKLTADEITEIINAKHPRGFEETLMQQGIKVPSAVEMKAIGLLKDKVEISAEKLDVYNTYIKVVDIYKSLMANEYSLSLAERYKLFKESDNFVIKGINASLGLAKTTFGFMMLSPFINILNQLLGVEEGSRAFIDAVKATLAIQVSFVAGNKIWNAMDNIGEKVDDKVLDRVDIDLSMTGLLNVIDGKENKMAITTMIDNWSFKRATDKLDDAIENSLELQNNINTDLTLDKLEGYFDNKSEFVEIKSSLKENGLIVETGNEEILTNNGKIIANEVLKIQNSATSDNDIKVLESYARDNTDKAANATSVASTANTAKQSTSNNKEIVNTLVQLQDKGVLAKSENEGWTTEAILGVDQMIENKDADNLIKELKTYTKEGVNISELPVLDSSEIEELEDAADELIRTISNKDSRTDKVKNVATSFVRPLANRITSQNESKNESVKKIEKQIKAQENFNKVKEQIAQKYEIENNITLAETVRRLDVEDGKVIFKNNVKQVQDVEIATVEEQVIEKVKETDISEEIEFENLMMEYVDSNSNVLVKSLPKIIDILLEKYDIKDTGNKQAVKALIGVTKPEEAQVALKALFAVFDKSDDIAKLFGYTSIEDVVANASRDNITNRYREMVNKLSSKEVVNMGYVSLLSMARDVMTLLSESKDAQLIAAVKAGDVDNITNKLLVSKAVNMNYIVKKTIEKKDDGDFVIDLNKIKSAVENPNLNKERPEELLKKLADAFDGGIKNSRADIKNALMDLSNIHAIQAAA